MRNCQATHIFNVWQVTLTTGMPIFDIFVILGLKTKKEQYFQIRVGNL